MHESYSLHEAKADLPALVRRVRAGALVMLTVRGKPVAEIRSVEPEPESLPERIEWLTRRGAIVPATRSHKDWKLGPRKPGALKRFLRERGG